MKIAFFDAKEYDIKYFDAINNNRHQITYFKENLSIDNAYLTKGFDAVCGFVNTYGDKFVLDILASNGVKVWLQRSMGYNKINLAYANQLGINVFRVPNYSAESVAEFAACTMMALNRNLVIAQSRVKNFNFSLNNLDGKVVYGSTVSVIGAGKIGQCFINIVKGMGAKVLVFDTYSQQNFPELAQKMGFEYVSFKKAIKEADFISLHAPLLPSTKYLIDDEAVKIMKDGVIIVNTARGELIELPAIIKGLKSKKIAGVAVDVLEREEGRFYEDVSAYAKDLKTSDPEWAELLKMDNVIVTSHQAFLTNVALEQIAKITLANADDAQNQNFEKALVIMENGRVKNG
ncbi:2-hydroxyacid dehydrogenase [Mycoplasmopsis hyopharyngis]|uniref:2-hydroxyacid dehydrogenase n=1 Tax=Mycoplasmopsis hyopharyngis TaxID=29558 RepID=UPI003872D2B1